MNGLLRMAIGLSLVVGCSSSRNGGGTNTAVNPIGGKDAGQQGNDGQPSEGQPGDGQPPEGQPGDGSDAQVPDRSNGNGGDGGMNPVTSVTPIINGCEGQKLREGIPANLAAHGPWPVGALTTTLGNVTTEVWYPAKQGSDKGKTKVVYDIRDHLPDADAKLVPDDHNPWQVGDCYRDLPLDEEAGPYPVLLFIHGTAGFRTTNLDNVTHWASRGFVVIAADHPGIQLKDMLATAELSGGGGTPGRNQAMDARAMLTDLAKSEGDIAFLKGHIDMTKVGAMGHSAGGQAVSSLGDLADVIIVYAAGATVANPSRATHMMNVMGSMDGVAGGGTGAYDGSTTPTKRYVSITNGGHLVGGNLCTLRDPTDSSIDIVDLAERYKLGGPLLGIVGVRNVFGGLFNGCNEKPDDPTPFIPASRGIEIMNYASAGAFEELLHCSDVAAALTDMRTVYGADVASYKEVLP